MKNNACNAPEEDIVAGLHKIKSWIVPKFGLSPALFLMPEESRVLHKLISYLHVNSLGSWGRGLGA